MVKSGRDLDAPRRGRRVPRSKTGMLEMTPRLVFRGLDPKNVDMHQKTPTYVNKQAYAEHTNKNVKHHKTNMNER